MLAELSIETLDARIYEVEQLVQLDSDACFHTQLVTLKRSRNALTPLCATPDEITARILAELVIRPKWSSFFETEALDPVMSWVSVMLVCSRIRQIALQTPALWSFIDGSTNPARIMGFIKRAGTHPLHVTRVQWTTVDLPMLHSIFCSARVVDLEISQDELRDPDFTGDQLEKHLPTHLPNLQSLSVRNVTGVVQSTAFLNERCDQLAELSLWSIALYQPTSFTQLLRLKLEHVSKIPGIDSFLLLDLLRNTPLLEVIDLNYLYNAHPESFCAYLEQAVSAGHYVLLPYLRVLSITDVSQVVSELLQVLPDPSQALSIRISSDYSDALHVPNVNIPENHRQRVIKHVEQFWGVKSNQALPSGRLELPANAPIRINFGRYPSAVTSAPSVFYSSMCRIMGPDPLLDAIETVDLKLDEDFPSEESRGAEPLERRLRSLDFLPTLQRVVLSIRCGSLTVAVRKTFRDWLRRRQKEGHPVDTFTAHALDRVWEAKAWASDLVEEGLVQKVMWRASR
jgi:hypothetical protein